MSEYIKTALDIYWSLESGSDIESDSKWVSLSWLKEQIQKRYKKNENNYGKEHSGAELENCGLDWVLSLLEEK